LTSPSTSLIRPSTRAIDHGKRLLSTILATTKIKEPKVTEGEARNYQALVDKLFAEREGRVKKLSNG